MNQPTLHATRLADMASASPSHGPGLQLRPCGTGDAEGCKGKILIREYSPETMNIVGIPTA